MHLKELVSGIFLPQDLQQLPKVGSNHTNACKNLVGKLEGKRQFGKTRRKWEGIRMDLREIAWGGVEWIHMYDLKFSRRPNLMKSSRAISRVKCLYETDVSRAISVLIIRDQMAL
jgi:hypothetical protein